VKIILGNNARVLFAQHKPGRGCLQYYLSLVQRKKKFLWLMPHRSWSISLVFHFAERQASRPI